MRSRTRNRGQAVMVSVIFFLFVSLSLVLGISSSSMRELRSVGEAFRSKQSYFTAESGGEDAAYRLKTGKQLSISETLFLGNATATISVSDVGSNEKEVLSTGDFSSLIRKIRTSFSVASGVAFNYGVQAGEGGFFLENNSTINGNVYSSGSVVGSNSNLVKGDVISTGATGLVSGIHATSSVYAHTITNATIDGDAYYQIISDSDVEGDLHPNSPDQEDQSLPISDELIAEWEADAAAGGTISSPCPYKITGTATIGPKKITCDLEISGNNFTVTLTGPIWVTGNVEIQNSPTIRISSFLGNKSVAIIADNPSNQTTSSKVLLNNSAVFQGTGLTGSYVLFVSQNKSAELGGSEKAIDIANSASGDLLVYSGHGEISLQNSVSLKEVTGYKISVKNFAQVSYSSGLASLLFSGGPSGAFGVTGWREVK